MVQLPGPARALCAGGAARHLLQPWKPVEWLLRQMGYPGNPDNGVPLGVDLERIKPSKGVRYAGRLAALSAC